MAKLSKKQRSKKAVEKAASKKTTKKKVTKKKTTVKKKANKKAATKKAEPREGTIIYKAMQVYKANKAKTRKEIIVLISKKLKCTVVRAGQIYQDAKRRVENA